MEGEVTYYAGDPAHYKEWKSKQQIQHLIQKLNEIDNLIEYGFADQAHIEILKILASLEGIK